MTGKTLQSLLRILSCMKYETFYDHFKTRYKKDYINELWDKLCDNPLTFFCRLDTQNADLFLNLIKSIRLSQQTKEHTKNLKLFGGGEKEND